MWPHKKEKGMTIRPGESIEIGFGVEWIKDKEEVIIITDSGKFVLSKKTELFLEVVSSNAGSIKVQIVPDFKNRKINVVEVLDVDTVCKTGKNGRKISLESTNTQKNDTVSIDKYLEHLDKFIDDFGKKIKVYKRRVRIYTVIGIVAIVTNAYLFISGNTPIRYVNIVGVIIMAYALHKIRKSYANMCSLYEECKENRSKAFNIVKSN